MGERIVKGIWFPIEIWEASDLSWNEKILLMEVDSFTSQGKPCFISDEYVAELLKVGIRTAGQMVSNLINKGYIKKVGFNGRMRFLESTLAEQVGKICGAGRQNLRNTDINILNEEDKSSSDIYRTASRFDFKNSLIDIGVSQEVAQAWMEVRRKKKAVNSEIAFRKVEREIAQSGRSADECIRCAVENSWQGFEAAWMVNKSRTGTGKASALEQNMHVAELLFGKGGGL